MKKKVMVLLGGVGIAAVLFAAGFVAGVYFISPIAGHRMLQDELITAVRTYSTLDQLDHGNIQGAKDSLNTTLDGSILAIDMFLQEAPNDHSMQSAAVWLKRIARHREQYPVPMQSTIAETRDSVLKAVAREAVSNALARALRDGEAEPRLAPDR